jgi:ribosome maturation factor RimP
MSLEDKIAKAIEFVLEERPSLFLVDCVVSGMKNRRKISVFLDTPKGITIDECGEFSNALGGYLETNEIIDEAYVLEVSSPGMDRPLQVKQQYLRRIGNSLKILTNDGKEAEVKLLAVNESDIEVIPVEKKSKKKKDELDAPELSSYKINFQEIKKCNLIVSFK